VYVDAKGEVILATESLIMHPMDKESNLVFFEITLHED
jgi:hypothetical protein